jgi:hypothetical protein
MVLEELPTFVSTGNSEMKIEWTILTESQGAKHRP